MKIYYIYFLSILGYMFIDIAFRRYRPKKFLMILMTIQFVLLVGFRDVSVGTDTINYFEIFNYLETENFSAFWQGTTEKHTYVFRFINFIVWKLGGSFQLLLVIVAAMAVIPVMNYIYKNSKDYILSVLIYFSFNYYLWTFITIRQSIAYGLALLSIQYIKKRKLKPFLIIMLLSSGIHISSLFFIPAYWLYKLKISSKTLIKILVIEALVYAFRIPIAQLLINTMFKSYTIQMSDSLANYLLHILIAVFALLMYKSNYLPKYEERIKALGTENSNQIEIENEEKSFIEFEYILFLVGTIVMLGCSVTSNGLRIANFYAIQILLILPNIVYFTNDRLGKLLVKLGVVVGCFFVFNMTLDELALRSMEYVPFWASM